MHRASTGGDQLVMDLSDGQQLASLLKSVERGRRIAKSNPQISEAAQDNTSFRVSNDLNRALAFGCFAPRIYLRHTGGPRHPFEASSAIMVYFDAGCHRALSDLRSNETYLLQCANTSQQSSTSKL